MIVRLFFCFYKSERRHSGIEYLSPAPCFFEPGMNMSLHYQENAVKGFQEGLDQLTYH